MIKVGVVLDEIVIIVGGFDCSAIKISEWLLGVKSIISHMDKWHHVAGYHQYVPAYFN